MLVTPIYSLLSLNVLCGSVVHPFPYFRLSQQARKVRHLEPDIVCLQEFNNPLVEHVYRKELGNRYDFHVHRVEPKELFRRGCLWSGFVLTAKMVHPVLGWICLGTFLNPYVLNFVLGTQKTGNAILTHKDFPQVDHFSYGQPMTSHVHEFKHQQGDVLNWMRRRGYVDLRLGNRLVIRNTHLNYGRHPKYEQMHECTAGLESPSLLVGDFNTQDVVPVLNKRFVDTTQHLGPTYRRANPLTFGLFRDKRIDYIFSSGVSIVDSTKLDMLSDHDALFVHFHMYPYAKRRLATGTNTAKKHHMLATEEE